MAKAETIRQEFYVVDKATGTLKRIQKEEIKTGNTMKGVSNSSKSLSKNIGLLAKSFGALAVAGASLKFLKDSVKTFANFEAQMNKTRAVSGATVTQMEQLSKQARELGATTANSASQVGELQFELSKLGFSVDDITKLTPAVGNLSLALGEDLAKTASIAGKTLRQFGLEAEEMTRVVDNIAQAASSSALDMTSFSEAMKFVGGTAGQLGYDIEETTAAVGALANVGIEGTLAGTGLNQVLLKMADSSSKAGKLLKGFTGDADDLQGKLEYLNKQGLTANEVFDTFGLVAGKSALALIRNADAVGKLEEKMKAANGRASEMTEIMQQGIVGNVKQLSSSFEALKIEIGKAFAPAALTSIKAATSLMRSISDAVKFMRAQSGQEGLLGSNWREDVSALKQVTYQLDLLDKKQKELAETGNSFKDIVKATQLKETIADTKETIKLLTAQNEKELDRVKLKQKIIDLKIKEAEADALAQLAIKEKAKLEAEAEKARLAASQKRKATEEELKRQEQQNEIIEARGKAYGQIEKEIAQETKKRLDEQQRLEKAAQEFRDSWYKSSAETVNNFYSKKQELQMQDAEVTKANAQELAQAWKDAYFSIAQTAISTASGIANVFYGKQMDAVRSAMQEEIDAINNRDKKLTAAEKRKQKEILEVKKKYAQEEYKLKTAQWVVQGLEIASTGALAVTKALASAPPPANIPLAATTGVAVAGQLAVWGASKPEPPKFANGGVVGGFGGASMGADNTTAIVRSGEMILNADQQRQLFDMANGGTTNNVSMGGISITIQDSVSPELTALAVQEALEDAQRRGMALV